MVLDIKTGVYWVEQAPLGFEGRPPSIEDRSSETDIKLKTDKKNELIKYLDDKAKLLSKRSTSTSTDTDTKYYSIRSIPVIQRRVLLPIEWREINDAVTYRQNLPGNIIFAQISSGISFKKYDYVELNSKGDKNKKEYIYIYFLPSGMTTPTSIKFAMHQARNKEALDEEGLKYTVNLNTLTGGSQLLEGFHDANFTLPKK